MRIHLKERDAGQRVREDTWECSQFPFDLVLYRLPLVIVSRRAWIPPTDVYETEDEVMVELEIPGVNQDDLVISAIGRSLLISGRRVDPRPQAKTVYHRMEIQYGTFETEVHLPLEVAGDRATAEYHDGFLSVRLPKTHARRVSVSVEE